MAKAVHPVLRQFRAARNAGTPIVSINTPDPAATIELISDGVKGDPYAVTWDICRGFMSRSKKSLPAVALIRNSGDAVDCPTVGNPAEAMRLAARAPAECIVFVLQAHRYLNDPMTAQGIWLLRDLFKTNKRTLVLLGPSIDLPAELRHDVVAIDEPLPDAAQLGEIVRKQHTAAGLEKPSIEAVARAVEAVQGLPAFPAEQVTAMSLTRAGLDLPSLWERKRQSIEQTPGLKVHRGAESFGGIGGVSVAKAYLQRIMDGQHRPNAVVFVDEIEKMMAGAAGGHDSSGVSQDQLGTLLSYMQDTQAAGVIFVGPPGSAKSMVAKAAGNSGGVPTIKLDLGAAKGSLVGQSEQQLRSCLKVIDHVSNGRTLWIATCNAIASLPPELRRRFTLGTFFFDLPDADERAAIWPIQLAAHGLGADLARPNDEGWTGAEIAQCCDIATRLGVGLDEAAGFVVPVSRSAADQLRRLRAGANGRFLSASHPGVYSAPSDHDPAHTPHNPAATDRGITLDDEDD